MSTMTTFLSKIEHAKDLDFGDIFNRCIELFKRTWLQGLVTLLLTMVLMLPFYLIIYMPLIFMGIIDPEAINNNGQPNMAVLIPMYIAMFVLMFFAVVIGFGLKAAFYRICKAKDFGETSTDDYFYFFKKPYLSKTIKMALTTLGISFVAAMLCFFPIIYVMVPVALMNVIYAFNPDLTVSEIVKIGFKLGNKKWLITFGLLFVAGLVANLGVILCFVGVLATASLSFLPPYFIYKDVIGFEEESEIARIGTSE